MTKTQSAKRKHDGTYTERQAMIERETLRRLGDKQWKDWDALMRYGRCTHCSVLYLVPYDKRTGRYVFTEASFTHELGCPYA